MAEEIRCPACEGPLGWSGAQLSCRACGKVCTIEGKPGSKFGVLVVGVAIGCILGFIGAYELIRFVPSIQPQTDASTVGSTSVISTPAQSPAHEDELTYFVTPHEFEAMVLNQPVERVKPTRLAENTPLDVGFELHHARESGSRTWLYGRVSNRSPVTVNAVKAFAIRKDAQGTVDFQDEFYATHDCLAPGQSAWVVALIDTSSSEDLTFEVYPETASHCKRPALGLTTQYDVRRESDKTTVYGSVTNTDRWGAKFVEVQVYRLSDETDRKLVSHDNTYLKGILSSGKAQRFSVEFTSSGPADASHVFEVVVDGVPTTE